MKLEQQKTRNEIIVNMDKQGHSQHAIAKAVGLAQSRISQLLNAYRESPESFFDNRYKGKPPLIAHKCRYKHFCVISAICDKGKMFWNLRPDAFKGQSIVQFLRDLMDFAKKKILVIWDGASIHRSEEVKSLLASMKENEIWLERIPPYSPELNADEQVWNHLKAVLLKNTCAHNLKELESHIKYAMGIIEESPELIRSFFKHPEVGYY